MSGDMPRGYRQTGENRFRETVGLGYHELREGLIIEHRPGRTVTETDNVLMTMLGGNDAPLHTDNHYSSLTHWGRPLVCSSITLHLVGGMTVRSTSGLTTANLSFEEVRFTHPVFAGDTLYAQTQITGRRLSNSRPDTGIVTCRTTGHNQDGKTVITFTRSFLVPIDADAVRDHTNY
ncbi:Mesaconyl-CoA hydratase (plasmid) [Streptomyces xanthophaeus]|uniref:MaoC family dehydratase n=1 Tax=Streptomyces xanthophaeus TaxID=67385 RepID=UPI00233F7222|nr:MaoC family dehydratase [Streptomyces xanthophaeus]WCD91170.1 Mesaconyl-CoA hydratase [Streptomyces xanthophaeus]